MERRTVWILDRSTLHEELERSGSEPLAVDVEGDSLHHYPEKVCLVQVSCGETDLLIDPLASADLSPLAPHLDDPNRRKIFHGADYDLRMLDRDFGLRVQGLFDTMIAARFTGERAFGLASLLERHLGVRLDKRFQRADWSLRPLPADMAEYAVADTRHLVELAAILEDRLVSLGRMPWVSEEFERLGSLRWCPPDDAEAFRRVKGAGTLRPRELAVLRAVHAWRERRARERDRPPFKILSNETLLELARTPPTDRATLAATPRIPAYLGRGGAAAALLDEIRRAVDLDDDELPAVEIRRRPRPSPEFERRIRSLKSRRDSIAKQMDLEPSLLAPRNLLEKIAGCEERGEAPESISDIRRWQVSLLNPLWSGGPSRPEPSVADA